MKKKEKKSWSVYIIPVRSQKRKAIAVYKLQYPLTQVDFFFFWGGGGGGGVVSFRYEMHFVD